MICSSLTLTNRNKRMGRKKIDNPKVPLTLSVKRTTKDAIRSQNINAGEILDNMFNQNDKDNDKQ